MAAGSSQWWCAAALQWVWMKMNQRTYRIEKDTYQCLRQHLRVQKTTTSKLQVLSYQFIPNDFILRDSNYMCFYLKRFQSWWLWLGESIVLGQWGIHNDWPALHHYWLSTEARRINTLRDVTDRSFRRSARKVRDLKLACQESPPFQDWRAW